MDREDGHALQLVFAEDSGALQVGRIAEFFRAPQTQTPDRAADKSSALPADGPHFLRRMNAVGRADDVRC